MKRRRAFLGLVAATALAGCSSSNETSDTPEPTPEETPKDTPTPTPEETPTDTPTPTPEDTPTPEPPVLIKHPRRSVNVKQLTVTGQLENTDSPVTVALEVDGQVVETQATDTFEITAEGVTPGEQEYTISTRDNSMSNSIEIPQPLEIDRLAQTNPYNSPSFGDGKGNTVQIDPLILRNPNDGSYQEYEQEFAVHVEGELVGEGTFSEENYVGGEEITWQGETYDEGAYVINFELPWKHIGIFEETKTVQITTHGSELEFELSPTVPHDHIENIDETEEYGYRLSGIEGTGALVDATFPGIQNDEIENVELVCGFGSAMNDPVIERYEIPDITREYDIKIKMASAPAPLTLATTWASLNYEPDELPDRSITDVPDNPFRRVFIGDAFNLHREEGYISYTMEVLNLYDEPVSVDVITCPHVYFNSEWPRKEITIEMSADEDVKHVDFEHSYEPVDEFPSNHPGIVVKQ